MQEAKTRTKPPKWSQKERQQAQQAERDAINRHYDQIHAILWLWCWKTVNTTDPEQGEVTQ
jgi:hypothetical protein